MSELKTIKDIMSHDVIYVNYSDSIKNVSNKMSKYNVSSLLVKTEKEIGIITEKDIVSKFCTLDSPRSMLSISNFMSYPVICIEENDEIESAVNIMTKNKIKKLAVINKNKNIIGIISMYDIMKYHPELISNIHRGYDINSRWARHDMRGALLSASSSLSVMKKNPNLSEKCIPIIEKSLNYMCEIIEEWKRSEDTINVNCESVEVSKLMQSSIKTVFIPNSVKVTYSIKGEQSAFLDYTKMIRVLSNLIKNSLEAMEGKGSIHLDAKGTTSGLYLKVRDSGSGIKPELLTRIFNPMFSTKSRGLGLGLAFVKDVVEAHGGEVKVISVPEKMTEFTIYIPNKTKQSARYFQ